MMTPVRTIIDLPDDQVERLDAHCRSEGISRAEAIRRAVAAHIRAVPGAASPAFGLWAGRGVDGLAYERARRREWSAGSEPAVRAARSRRRRKTKTT
jgi:hypothetical protein